MATLTVAPEPVMQFFADLTGEPLAGGKVSTYAAGTTTPLATYTDSAGLVPNANPLTLDAYGKAAIFLSPALYKIDVQNAAGVSQSGYPADNISALSATNIFNGISYTFPAADGASGQVLSTNGSKVLSWITLASVTSISVNNFRLSLTSGLPVTTADVTAATTLYATPTGGNQIALYDIVGNPTVLTSAQFSIAVPATTSQMYDVFCYNNSGVATLELLAWTSDTARATAIALTTTGVYCKSGDLTRRYLGSFRTTGVAGQTEDSFAKRYVWNYYNRAPRLMRVLEATNTWTYTLVAWQQANAAATNQLDLVVGVADVPIDVEVRVTMINGGGGGGDYATVGIGEDSTTTLKTGTLNGRIGTAITVAASLSASLKTYPPVGRHTYVWLEQSTAVGTTTWWGDNNIPTIMQSGIHGVILG